MTVYNAFSAFPQCTTAPHIHFVRRYFDFHFQSYTRRRPHPSKESVIRPEDTRGGYGNVRNLSYSMASYHRAPTVPWPGASEGGECVVIPCGLTDSLWDLFANSPRGYDMLYPGHATDRQKQSRFNYWTNCCSEMSRRSLQ